MNNVALISINKKIAAALERADIRAMKIEKNMDQLKSFKRMMEYAENMFCKVLFLIQTCPLFKNVVLCQDNK